MSSSRGSAGGNGEGPTTGGQSSSSAHSANDPKTAQAKLADLSNAVDAVAAVAAEVNRFREGAQALAASSLPASTSTVGVLPSLSGSTGLPNMAGSLNILPIGLSGAVTNVPISLGLSIPSSGLLGNTTAGLPGAVTLPNLLPASSSGITASMGLSAILGAEMGALATTAALAQGGAGLSLDTSSREGGDKKRGRRRSTPGTPRSRKSTPAQHRCTEEGCTAAFRSANDLRAHMRVHNGERPFLCSFPGCTRSLKGNGFAHISNLRQHERSHKGSRPYRCRYPDCDKTYAHPTSRNDHEAVFHRGERPYICGIDDCPRAFTSRANLTRHYRDVHNVGSGRRRRRPRDGQAMDEEEEEEEPEIHTDEEDDDGTDTEMELPTSADVPISEEASAEAHLAGVGSTLLKRPRRSGFAKAAMEATLRHTNNGTMTPNPIGPAKRQPVKNGEAQPPKPPRSKRSRDESGQRRGKKSRGKDDDDNDSSAISIPLPDASITLQMPVSTSSIFLGPGLTSDAQNAAQAAVNNAAAAALKAVQSPVPGVTMPMLLPSVGSIGLGSAPGIPTLPGISSMSGSSSSS